MLGEHTSSGYPLFVEKYGDINLCQSCKEVHYHRIPDKEYYSIKDIVDSNKSLINNKNEVNPKIYILKELISSYKFFENYYMIPWVYRKSLYFNVNDQDLIINHSEFFFEEFFDSNFCIYYSKLIEKASRGKMNAFNTLKEIKQKYIENNIFSFNYPDN